MFASFERRDVVGSESEYFFGGYTTVFEAFMPIFFGAFWVICFNFPNDPNVAGGHHVDLRLATRHVVGESDLEVLAVRAISHQIDVSIHDLSGRIRNTPVVCRC